MVPLGRLLDALSEVPDPRRAEGERYSLAPLLLFTVLALLSGATSFRHINCFLEQRRIVLTALFGCTLKRAPSLNTLRTVLQMLDRDALEEAFRQQAWDLLPPAELGRMPVVAIDGKTLKGSSPALSRTYKEYEEMLFAKKLNADPAGTMPATAKAVFPASIAQ
jgi:hypothetical protein